MTKRRIVERTYKGMTRYIVQYKVAFWWIDNSCFHVGNSMNLKYDELGYYYLEGAQACLSSCIGSDYIGEKVIE